MRYLGVDYGRARIGIAVSDPEGKIAFPRQVIAYRSMRQVIAAFKDSVAAEGIEEIVAGLPVGLDGQDTEETAAVRVFAEALAAALGLPVHLENEMFTTRMAEAAGGKGKMSDASAAAIILQSYLDKKIESRK